MQAEVVEDGVADRCGGAVVVAVVPVAEGLEKLELSPDLCQAMLVVEKTMNVEVSRFVKEGTRTNES